MAQIGAQGFPAFVLQIGEEWYPVPHGRFASNPPQFRDWLDGQIKGHAPRALSAVAIDMPAFSVLDLAFVADGLDAGACAAQLARSWRSTRNDWGYHASGSRSITTWPASRAPRRRS